MQGRRESKSRLNNAAHQMLTNSSLRETTEAPRKSDSLRLEDLQNELLQKEMTIAALQRNYEGISHIYREEKSKSSEWFEKVSTLEKENLSLRSKIQTFESQKQKALADLDKTQDELAKLLKGIEEVRAVKTENVTIKLQFEKKKKECEEFFHKMEIYKSEAESLRKIRIDLESVNRKLKTDGETNIKELRKILSEYEEYRNNNQSLEGKYAELLSECESLRSEINKKTSQGSSAEQQLLALRQKISSDKLEFNFLSEKNSEMLVLIENYKDSLAQCTNKLNLTEKTLQEKIKNLSSENCELKIKISEIESLEYESQLKTLQDVMKIKNQELEKWKNEAKSITETLNNVLISNQETKKSSQDKISELLGLKEEEFKKYLNDKDSALNECRNRIEDLMKKSEKLAEENRRLKEEEFQKYLSDKDSALNDCRRKIEDLLKNSEILADENKKLKADFHETDQMYSFTKKSLQQVIDENIKLKESLNKLINEIENLRKKLIEEMSEKKELQILVDDLNKTSNTIDELKHKINDLSQKYDLTEKRNSELQQKLEKSENELKESYKKTFESQQNIINLENIIENHKTETLQLVQEKKQLTLSNKNLENESEKLHKIISSLTKEVSDSKETLKTSKELISKFEVQLSSREMDIARLENQLLVEKSNYKNAVEDNSQLVNKIQEMREERDRIKILEESLTKKSKNLVDKEKSILKSLERVENALNSLENNLACHSCFGPLENAVVCIPCGHIHCGNCKPTDFCKECEDPVKQMIQISRFDEIYGKIVYQKQAIADMKHLLSVN